MNDHAVIVVDEDASTVEDLTLARRAAAEDRWPTLDNDPPKVADEEPPTVADLGNIAAPPLGMPAALPLELWIAATRGVAPPKPRNEYGTAATIDAEGRVLMAARNGEGIIDLGPLPSGLGAVDCDELHRLIGYGEWKGTFVAAKPLAARLQTVVDGIHERLGVLSDMLRTAAA